ncbi:hypothetical protein SELMODRAFT_87848 [Selaginella moellendorffii]|uniref:Dirigent protein n=1 Tax=Selaginella moellendorffii TaxID=88036 RepID=D8R896_SELML|nr:dirigent protein 1 [Selaginella moellendorffii]EFJ32025.1 hypothetical protein SELMODRAFT_87848 [Selaginella moellendorffii]|eukprot:XP_002967426.1 dirigent protein 1 [Selaginella moellendorffii]
MRYLSLVLSLCVLFFLVATANGSTTKKQGKVTFLQFYMHDIVTAKHPTAVMVAKPPSRNDSFGLVMIIDDLITQGPSSSSKVLGRGQGTYMVCSLTGINLLFSFAAVLDTPEYKGTISFHGLDMLALTVREFAVTGGTGDFRSVRGYATIETQALKGLNAVLLFKVYLTY